MRSRLLISLGGGVLLLGAATLVWIRTHPTAMPEAVVPSASVRSEESEAAERLAPTPEEAGGLEPARVEVALVNERPSPSIRLPAERGRALLEVRVVDPAGAAVAGAHLLVRSHTGPRPDLYALEDDRGVERRLVANERGRADLADLPTGPYEVLASATPDDPPTAVRALLAEPTTKVLVTLEQPYSNASEVLVRVVGVGGEPVAGATVEITGGAGDLRGGRSGATATQSARGDEQGIARFRDPGYHGLVVVALAPDGRRGSTAVWTRANVVRKAGRGGIEVGVDATATLEGALVGLPAERLAGARVLARLLNNSFPHYTTHGRDFETPVVGGRYAFTELAAGTYTLSLDDPGGARLVLPPFEGWGQTLSNSIDPIEVELAAGARVVRDLPVTAGGVLEGLVLDERGAPLADAAVRDTLTPRTANFPDGFYVRGANVWRYDSESGGADDHPESHRRTTSDASGRYRLAGLQPGQHRVEVTMPGRLYDRREEVELRDGETVRLEHVLVAAGAIQGIARAGGYLGVRRPGDGAARMVAIVSREGLFCFPGLEPGTWSVAQFHSDTSVEPVPLVTVEVEAGRTTWVDVDAEATLPVRITGRVLDGSGPVAGVQVVAWPLQVETDGAGRFELGSAFPWTHRVSPTVQREGISVSFEFPGMHPDDRRWEGDLMLGEHELVVRTEDVDGRPTAARLSLWLHEGGPEEISSLRGERLPVGPDGELSLGWLPRGAYELRARFPDVSDASTFIELPRADPVVLRATATGTLEVLVRYPDGRPAADWRVVALTWIGDGPAPDQEQAFYQSTVWRDAPTGADGRATLEGVRAGEVLVRAEEQRSGFILEPSPTAAARIALARGERASLELTLREP